MIIPLWATYSLLAALCVVATYFLQEHLKAEGFALAFWNKVFIAIFTLPFSLKVGLPTDPVFYEVLFVTSVLFCISDVIYFRAIPIVGSGLVSRTIPSGVLISFFLWFVVNPALLDHYLEHPFQTAGIVTAVLLAALSAFFLKRCSISWSGIKLIWFVIFAASVGPLFSKTALNHAPPEQATLAYTAIQALMMVALWLIYYFVRKPIAANIMCSRHNIKAGLWMGIFFSVIIVLKMQAVLLADNPAYISVLMYTDVLWVILIYKWLGRKETSNIWAGLGIVASAVMLIVFKSL